MNKVSIITINYNNLLGLKKTMQSVFAQTYSKLEYIVIDGGSVDGSAEYIEEHCSRLAYAISERDNGIFDAQNKGLKKAKGDYVLVLNAGDELVGENVIADVFADDQIDDLVCGDIFFCYPNGKRRRASPSRITREKIMVGSLWHPATFIKNNLLSLVGSYDTSYCLAADYAWFLRAIFLHNATVKYIDTIITNFYLDGVSADFDNRAALKNERRRAQVEVFGLEQVVAYEKKIFVRFRAWFRPLRWWRLIARQVCKG